MEALPPLELKPIRTWTDQVTANIRGVAAARGVTAAAVARSLGMSRSAFNKKWNGDVRWFVSDIEAVADILQVAPWQLCSPKPAYLAYEDFLPRYDETLTSFGEGRSKLVAGRGFEPPTSGL